MLSNVMEGVSSTDTVSEALLSSHSVPAIGFAVLFMLHVTSPNRVA